MTFPMDEPSAPAAESEPPGGPSPFFFPRSGQSPVFYGPNGLRAGWRLLVFLAILSVLFSATALVLRIFRHAPFRGEITPGAQLCGEGLPLLLVLLARWIMAKMERRTIGGLRFAAATGIRSQILGRAASLAFSRSAHCWARCASPAHFILTASRCTARRSGNTRFCGQPYFSSWGCSRNFFSRLHAVYSHHWNRILARGACLSAVFGYVHHRNQR